MAEPSWQELLRLRLIERDSKENSFSSVIEQYRRLAQQTKLLKERNATLLRAVNSVKSSPNSSATSTAVSSEEYVPHPIKNVLPFTPIIRNPVRAAYLASLESQISSLRDELATVYKTQGQNAQRLLAMNETLREKEELARIDTENLRKAKDELAALKRKVDQHAELMREKDRTVQILHDEISTLQLELGQIEERNQNLQKDNAKLLQRWLDAKQAEANKMNEANAFYEDMRSRHQTNSKNGTNGSDASPSSSGKGEPRPNHQETGTLDGSLSPMLKMVNLTPNG